MNRTIGARSYDARLWLREQIRFNLGRWTNGQRLLESIAGSSRVGAIARHFMGPASDLNRKIVEDLYCEALLLADEARCVFDLSPVRDTSDAADKARMALSVEGLRATTRIMHVLAWLLNHRAFYEGELSEFQLRRHSKLPADRPSDEASLELLAPGTRKLVLQSQMLHQRVGRLDAQWRDRFEMRPAAILRLRERLNRAVFRN